MTSIRRRMIGWLLVACSLLWACGGIALYLMVRAGLVMEFDSALEATSVAIAPMSEYTDGKIEFDSGGELMPSFEKRAARPDYFQVLLPDGSTLARSPSLRKKELPLGGGRVDPGAWDLTLPDGMRGRAWVSRFTPKTDEDAPAPEGDPGPGEVTLIVARHRADLDHQLTMLMLAILLVGASTSGATGAVVALVVGRGLRPLTGLGVRASAIDASSLQLRFPTEELPSELLPIAHKLNDLLARLEASFARERRFSADAAHELRTPIAELRTLAEVSLKWPLDGEAARAALNEALGIALQMESIATNLMALTRCEGRLLPTRSEIVPLAPLMDDVWQPLSEKARAKRLSVTMSVSPEAAWKTDPTALRTIVANLLSNAAEYSPVGGTIHLRAEGSNGGGRLTVSNTTFELARADLPHLFDRFWRKDPARSSSSHSGLGLSLAKAYAESLGMRLSADFSGPEELTVELSGGSSEGLPAR
jgi:two-component system sensor histidine kinase QseC